MVAAPARYRDFAAKHWRCCHHVRAFCGDCAVVINSAAGGRGNQQRSRPGEAGHSRPDSDYESGWHASWCSSCGGCGTRGRHYPPASHTRTTYESCSACSDLVVLSTPGSRCQGVRQQSQRHNLLAASPSKRPMVCAYSPGSVPSKEFKQRCHCGILLAQSQQQRATNRRHGDFNNCAGWGATAIRWQAVVVITRQYCNWSSQQASSKADNSAIKH